MRSLLFYFFFKGYLQHSVWLSVIIQVSECKIDYFYSLEQGIQTNWWWSRSSSLGKGVFFLFMKINGFWFCRLIDRNFDHLH